MLMKTALVLHVRVPHLHRFVMTAGGDPLAVGGERHTADGLGVPPEGDITTLELAFPVVPLEAAEVLIALLLGPVLLKQLPEAAHLILFQPACVRSIPPP